MQRTLGVRLLHISQTTKRRKESKRAIKCERVAYEHMRVTGLTTGVHFVYYLIVISALYSSKHR